jgi:signal transduction histidine kinase/ActR/RegA family two-component response regulator
MIDTFNLNFLLPSSITAPPLLLGQFIPHGHCYLWQTNLVWLHALSDGLTALAYFSIPITLFYFVRKRTDLPFNWVFLLFGAFIVACGSTHAMSIWTLWHPDYWLSGMIKATTAAVSMYTAIMLIPLVPRALALPSPAQLEAVNQSLLAEVQARQQAEAEVRTLNQMLEQRIAERTQQLESANQAQEQLLERERLARKEAEEANRIKDQFLATLSHELRTPLNAILGWTQLLQLREAPLSEFATKALATIKRSGQSLTRMIEDLLDVSRIVQGKLQLVIGPVDLKQVIWSAAETVRLAAEAKNITLQLHFDQEVGWVAGDTGRLQQVVWNLLSNAVKFTAVQGRVDVYLESVQCDAVNAQCAQIRVVDDGQGIAPDFLPHVFEHFRQADGSVTRSRSGLGLGLAVVRHLVELHGGRIEVESPGLNQGTTFRVKLPILEAMGDHKPPQTNFVSALTAEMSSRQPANLQGLHLLVVEDNAESRDVLVSMLMEHQATVTAVDSGQDALMAIQQQLPDAILSDIAMPQMDGYQFIQTLRSQRETRSIPAIAITAYSSLSDQTRAIVAGFQRHLSKPVSTNELVTTILSVVQSVPASSQPASHD